MPAIRSERSDKGLGRRTVLTSGAAVVGTAAVTGALAAPSAAAAGAAGAAEAAAAATGSTVRPGDPRYAELTTGNNQRFVARPDYIRMIRSSADAERALRDAVRAGKRVSVRSGGHCF